MLTDGAPGADHGVPTGSGAHHGTFECYASGACSLAELARGLGVSRPTARAELGARGITVRRPGRPSGSSALARILTEEYLRREYVERGRNVAELADAAGCTRKTLRRYLAAYRLDPPQPTGIRRPPPTGLPGTGLGRDALWEAYVVHGSSTTAIAAAIGCAPSTVARDLRRNGIVLRRRGGGPPPADRRRARRAGIRRGVLSADS